MSEQAPELLNQATTALQQGQFEASLQLADQALAADPSSGNAYLIRAIALSRLGQADLATAAFRSAIDVMPTSSPAHYNLAVHFHAQGMKRDALDSARRALELDANNGQARDLVNLLNTELGYGEVQPTQSAPMGSPYAGVPGPSGPYGGAPGSAPSAEYYRQGYSGAQTQGGAVAFVDRMGTKWDTFGLVLVVLQMVALVYGLINLANQWPLIMEAARTGQQANIPTTPLQTGFQIISWVLLFVSMFWVITDVINRRNHWLWIVLYVLCCCCGPFQFVYFFFGRKK
jgi:tetratricopeptide (TPR) repeat protein